MAKSELDAAQADYLSNKALLNAAKADLEYALSSSLGFGGHNACIALKRIDA